MMVNTSANPTTRGDDLTSLMVRAFNVEPEQAAGVVALVTPELSWAFEELSLSRGGLADLVEAIGLTVGGSSTGDHSTGTEVDLSQLTRDGNRLLALLFDSKYKSRSLASRVGRRTGLEPDLVKKMLPVLANQYVETVGRDTRVSFDNLKESVGSNDTFAGQEPLGVPGDFVPGSGGRSVGPYGDLSDLIRRGGRPSTGTPGGGYLWSIVRSILASALGFQNKGIFGWIISMIVYRWGWRIVSFILRRVFMGR